MKKYFFEMVIVAEAFVLIVLLTCGCAQDSLLYEYLPIVFAYSCIVWAINNFRKQLEGGFWLLRPEEAFANWHMFPTWLRALALLDKHYAMAIAKTIYKQKINQRKDA